MNNRLDGLDHGHRGFRLEDIAAHVNTGSTLLDGIVGHGEGIFLRDLFPARHDDRHRA